VFNVKMRCNSVRLGGWGYLVVAAFLSLLWGSCIALSPLVALGMTGAVVGVFLVFHPRETVVLLVGWVLCQAWLTQDLGLLPEWLKWGREFLLGVLVASAVVRMSVTRTTPKFPLGGTAVVAFIGVASISSLVNQSSFIGVVLYLRYFLQYFVFYCVFVYLEFDVEFAEKLLRLVFVWAFLQVPMTVFQTIQHTSSNFERVLKGDFDLTAGTLGLSQGDGLAFIMLSVVVVALALDSEGVAVPRMATGMLLFPIVLTTSRSMMFLGVVILLGLFCQALLRRRITASLLITGVAATLAIVLAVGYFSLARDADVQRFFSPWSALQDQFILQPGHFYGRLGWTGYILNELAEAPHRLWLGTGPGTFISYAAFNNWSSTGDLMVKAAADNRISIESGGGMAGGAGSDANVLLAEVGVLGLLTIMFLMCQIASYVRKVWQDADGPSMRGLTRGAKYVLIIMGVATVFRNGWEAPYLACLFWLLLAVLDVYYRAQEHEAAKSP